AMDLLANPTAQELDRVFTHNASSLTAKPVGSDERPRPVKGCIAHSSRVGLDRQDTLPKLRTAGGRERFDGVQIIENHDCLGWAYL
uniref:hypothetical protein n=1 Tax=Stenotrophomonas maltophilia TaxID=40324 RepID=UPI001954D9B9